MAIPIEVRFDRQVRERYPRGWADLEGADALGRLGLTVEHVRLMVFVRDAMNGALANAKMVPGHVVNGPYYFDYIDSEQQGACAFTEGDRSFIGLTIGMVQWVLGAGERLRSSVPLWELVGLDPDQTDANHFQFLVVYLALTFIVAHEYCHHVLGHQPDAIPQGDRRTASLRGNLQSHTREVAADGYAAMHQYDFVVHSAFRSQMVALLGLEGLPVPTQDRALFLVTLTAVASTWYRKPPAILTAENVSLLSHPPRAVRLCFFMEHAMIWCRGFRPTLEKVIDGPYFANLMYVIGTAVCADHADSRAQNALIRSPEGQEYQQALFDNLKIHKSLMGASR
jgi:hypothetical protein